MARWRKRAGAVLTGVGTVLEDNPARRALVETARQPLRVIVDSRLETPAPAPSNRRAPVLSTPPHSKTTPRCVVARGAEIALAPGASARSTCQHAGDLAQRGVNELHVEAGHMLSGSFVREGLVDEFLVYQAPKLVGIGHGLASFGPLERLDDALALRFVSIDRLGDDLRLILRPPGREHF